MPLLLSSALLSRKDLIIR